MENLWTADPAWRTRWLALNGPEFPTPLPAHKFPTARRARELTSAVLSR